LKSGPHNQDHLDLVLLYALRALPPSEIPAAEGQISSCEDCRREMDTIRPIVRSFVSWPTDVLRPSESLWGRLSQRISQETGQPPLKAPAPLAGQPEWEDVAPGISCKLLSTDAEKKSVSMLVRLEPGTDYPGHRHAGIEELHLLHGVLHVDEKTYHPGDYLRADEGSEDHRVWSETGCTCVLITSFNDKIL
jgi:hypothetical protein